MQPNGNSNGDPVAGPFASETHIRVLDVMGRRPSGWEIHAISEPGLHIVRARLNDGFTSESGDYIALDSGKAGPLSSLRFQDLTTEGNSVLQESVVESIKVNPHPHLEFYNRANNISLKVHAFQLLPGVGNKKALEMVASRGRVGWESFAQLDEDCNINAAELLARRFVSEIEDRGLQPRLLDLLLRQGE